MEAVLSSAVLLIALIYFSPVLQNFCLHRSSARIHSGGRNSYRYSMVRRLLHNSVPIADAETDACNEAVGFYFWGDWTYSFLPADAPTIAPLHINFKEAFAIFSCC